MALWVSHSPVYSCRGFHSLLSSPFVSLSTSSPSDSGFDQATTSELCASDSPVPFTFPDAIAESAVYSYPPTPATPAPPRAYPRAASCPPPPTQAHRHRPRPPHGTLLHPGPRARRGSLSLKPGAATSASSAAWVRWGRRACGTDAGGAHTAVLPMHPGVSKSYTHTLLPPATLLPTSKGRTLRLLPRDEGDVQQRLRRAPTRPRGNNNKNTNAHERDAHAFALPSRDRTDLCPTRTQSAPGLGTWG
ncbi:hypothetical protein C8R44DRAFT_991608 [Mycena epipterygia]|nr:hypothetical protein C8R44DRAFT_991608 [Mycena epipterygia]